MSVQTITLLIAILSLVCFFGVMFGIQVLVKQGKDPGKQLQMADSIVDTAEAANTAIKPYIPAPVENIIDMVLKVTQAGVHSAQQLYNSGQLPPDLRKEQATEYAVNMIKLTGREVTPELEHVIRGTAEAGVYIMKQKDTVPVLAVAPAPMTDTATAQPDTTATQPLGIPSTDGLQSAIDLVQQPA